MHHESKDEVFFDVQGMPGEQVTELVAKISAGALLVYFSATELMDELRDFRRLRRNRREMLNVNN